MIRRAALFAVFLIAAPAMRGQSVGIAPGQIDATFKAGLPFELAVNVANYGPTEVELRTEVTDLWYDAKNEKTFGTPGSSPRSAASWIQFVPETFRIAPNAVQRLKAIVTPRTDAKGGYYAALFVQSTPVDTHKTSKDGHAVFTNLRLGCLVLLKSEEGSQYDVNVGDLRIQPPSASHELTASFNVDNRSNTHIFALPRLAILDASRKLVAKAQSGEKRLFPAQKDAMTVSWSGTLAPGDYLAVLTVTYGGDRVETKEVAFRIP